MTDVPRPVLADAATTDVRDPAIELARYACAFLVVLLHALPSPIRPDYQAWCGVVASLCRVAVPFFFLTGGYFLRPPQRFGWTLVTRPLARLLPIYAFWLLIYVVVASATGVASVRFGPTTLVNGGPAYHLWFLTSLAFGMVVVGAGTPLVGRPAVLALSLLLAAVCVVRGPTTASSISPICPRAPACSSARSSC